MDCEQSILCIISIQQVKKWSFLLMFGVSAAGAGEYLHKIRLNVRNIFSVSSFIIII